MKLLLFLSVLISFTESVYAQPTWQFMSARVNAPSRALHTAAYDANTGKVIIWGGADYIWNGTPYSWNGLQWDQINQVGPNPRMAQAFAQVDDFQKIVLFGGNIYGNQGNLDFNDTWEYGSGGWNYVYLDPATVPAPRYGHGMTYDSARQKVVLFGGRNSNGTVFNDTWEYDVILREWKCMDPGTTTSPRPRFHSPLAYHEALGKTVLFGGTNDFYRPTSSMNDTWEWNGKSWRRILLPTVPPTPRDSFAMTYDPDHQVIVLTAGLRSDFKQMTDTWIYTNHAWKQLITQGHPGHRQWHATAYDRARHRLVLFGGMNDTVGDIDDTWELIWE